MKMFNEQLARQIDENADLHLTKASRATSHVVPKKRADVQKLTDMNLEDELLAQYQAVLDLQTDVINSDAPANQKAQVAGQVTTVLAQIIKMQEDLRRQERLRVMESVLVDTLRTLPKEAQEKFIADYQAAAAFAGLD